MKSFAILALFAALAAQGYAAFTVNTPPSIVQCQPVLLSWQEGTAPYYPTIIPGGQVSGAPLKSFDSTNSMQLTWNVDIPAGTSITVAIRDSTGAQVYSDKVTISSSSDSGCLNSSGSASTTASEVDSDTETETSASATGASTGPTSGASSAATRPSSAAASHAPASSSTPATTSSRATSSTSAARPSGTTGGSVAAASNGATRGSTMNAAGVAGLLGLVGAAFL